MKVRIDSQSLLRQFSPSFGALYDYCIGLIDLAVSWFYQPPGERRSEVILEPFPGEAHIYLSREVPTEIAEIHAAEELWHVLQYCQGFCIVVAQSRYWEWEPTAKALSSLLLDPLAYEAMPSFGLDLEPFFSDVAKRTGLEDVRLMMRDFERFGPEELRKYWGALLTFAGNMLELPSPFLEEVESLYHAEFPELRQAAKDLVATIRSRGFDAPGQQCALLRLILEENQLTQYVTVFRRSPARHT